MKIEPKQLLEAARVTGSGNGASVDTSQLMGHAQLVVNAGATEAADNTIDLVLEESDDDQTFTEVTAVSLTQLTNAGGVHEAIGFDIDKVGRYVRLAYTLGGTSPAGVLASELVAQPKY